MKAKFSLWGLIGLTVSLLAGCFGFLPSPISSEVQEGRKITRSEVDFIIPGQTTRLEVERRLGPPTRHCDQLAATAYWWETSGMTVYWLLLAPGGVNANNFQVGGRHAFFVAFDEKSIVRKADFVNLSLHTSLDDELENWAKGLQTTPFFLLGPSSAQ